MAENEIDGRLDELERKTRKLARAVIQLRDRVEKLERDLSFAETEAEDAKRAAEEALEQLRALEGE